MANAIASQVQALYVGYLGRAADQAGLDFWTNAIVNGTSTIESVALGFTLSQEYTSKYEGLSNEELVAAIYQNVLGRAADADGLAFWVGELEKGVQTPETLLAAMINSLGEIDQKVIDNKVLVANAFTTAAGENYDAAAGAKVLVGVDGTEASVEAALATIPGATFTLTEALAAETLPAGYVLSDATVDFGALAIADVAAAQAAAAEVVAGAANAAELELAATYTIADTLANVLAADAAVLAAAGSYSLTDATADLGALAIADVAAAQAAAAAVVAGAANAAELELAATYTIADTLANVLAADAAVLAAAGSYSLTNDAGALGELTEAEVAVVLGAENFADFTYTAAFTLTKGLEDLAAANAALDAFLLAYAQDPEVEGEEAAATPGDVTQAQTDAIAAVDDAILAVAVRDAALTEAEGDADDFVYVDDTYVTASAGVKAALLADAQAQLATRLAEAQADVAEVQADVDAVAGLTAAINAYAAAQDVIASAQTAAADAEAALAGAVSTFETRETSANELVVDGSGQYFLDAVNDDVAGEGDTAILTLDANGSLVVNPVWAAVPANATLVPYATALLNAVNADAAAAASLQIAQEAEYQAKIARDFLDLNETAEGHLAAVASKMVLTTLADGQMPTLKQIQTETTKLAGYLQTLTGQISSLQAGADANASITAFNALTAAQVANKLLTAGDKIVIDKAFADNIGDNGAVAFADAKAAAQTALAENNNSLDLDAAVAVLVDLTYAGNGIGDADGVNEGSSATNPLAAALSDAQALITNDDANGWQDLIDALDLALANQAQATTDVATLQALQADVNAALAAFDDNGFSAPETIDADNEYATPESDVFVVGTIADNTSTIANFGTLGDDTIFVGTNYVLNTGDIATAGDDSAFEVFIYDHNGVATVAIEQKAFGSNSSDAETVITLTGLTAADITFADGYITLV